MQWLAALLLAVVVPGLSSEAVPIRVAHGLVGEWHLSPSNRLFYFEVVDTSG